MRRKDMHAFSAFSEIEVAAGVAYFVTKRTIYDIIYEDFFGGRNGKHILLINHVQKQYRVGV